MNRPQIYNDIERALSSTDSLTRVVLGTLIAVGITAWFSPSRTFRLSVTLWYLLP